MGRHDGKVGVHSSEESAGQSLPSHSNWGSPGHLVSATTSETLTHYPCY